MFLPENYEAPKGASQGYMKLQDGENRIRILSQPIIGWEDWTEDKKPVRFTYNKKPDKSIDPKKPVKHFWAMIIWNYNEEKIQILQISQATIRKSLEKLCRDSDWGLPYFYDIKITKEGQSVDTEYSVNPIAPKPIDQRIIDEFNLRPVYLDALFEGADPFDSKWANHTPGIFSKEEAKVVPIKKENITKEQSDALAAILDQCSKEYKDSVWEVLHKLKIVNLTDLSPEMYTRIFSAAEKKIELPF